MKNIFLSIFFISLFILIGCNEDKIKVQGITSKIVKVVDGNTIELQNGLKVRLLGIKATEDTKIYLEREYKGATVKIIQDSKQPAFIKTYKTTIKAYVKVVNEGTSIAGKLLRNRIAVLNTTQLVDSLKPFAIKDCDCVPMSNTELLSYMKPRSFMIITESGHSGTGFFISEDGLALTNNHVLDGSENAVVCFFGENGTIDQHNTRGINDIVMTNKDEKIDFTVFYVQLHPNEKVPYMPLVSEQIKDGEEIFKIGCPIGLPADFQNGVLSNYNDGYFTHNIPCNHGDSGGPVVNRKGHVVGINQSIAFNQTINEQAKGIAFAVDVTLIKKLLEKKQIYFGCH